MRYRFRPEADLSEVKPALGEAFKALRRQGFVARQSFLCCRGCAGSALDTPENQGKPVVYFTRQDADGLRETGQVYLAYGVVGADMDTYAPVAERVVQAMNEAGLETEWDGSVYSRVLVKGMLPPPPEATYLDLVGAAA